MPTIDSTSQVYTVTATNSGGTDTASLTIGAIFATLTSSVMAFQMCQIHDHSTTTIPSTVTLVVLDHWGFNQFSSYRFASKGMILFNP